MSKYAEDIAVLKLKVNWILIILVGHVGLGGIATGLKGLDAVLTWLKLF